MKGEQGKTSDTTCPKCGWPKGEVACPKCGLVYDLYDPAKLDADVPEGIRELWSGVEAAWDDMKRHDLFIEQALASGCGGYAAACYRRRGDDPAATDQLAKLTIRLEQQLLASATGKTSKTAMSPIAKALLFLLFAAVGAFFSLWMLRC